ncbi:stage 0 sporulation family protein [Deferrisoma palaeochoriense]
MARVVGVRFKRASRVYHFDADGVECDAGDWVVVETERGMALGQVASPPRDLDPMPGQTFKKVLRQANERDILRYEQNCELEGYAFQVCLEKIRERGLPMKLVDVEYLFDGSKAIFYFTAEQRVDFRDLVRELAREFHVRIEMRQIGVRDEAKLVGGVGPCGRELCCATWLTDFTPVSVRMAKEQDVALNPTKISGVCGRLMCCLGYEHAQYKKAAKKFPRVGKSVETSRGTGKVIRRNVLEGTFVIQTRDGAVEIDVEEWGRPKAEPTGTPSAPQEEGSKERTTPKRRRERAPGPPEPRRSPEPSQPGKKGDEKAEETGPPKTGTKRRRRRGRRGPKKPKG